MLSIDELPHLLNRLRLDFYDTIPPRFAKIRHGTAGFLKSGYPKSGNNWVHFLIANAFVALSDRDDDIHFKNKNEWLSTTTPKKPPAAGFPRLLSNTDAYDDQQYLGPSTRTLYIVRHPGDVMESFYHYRKYQWNDDVGTFSEFIRTERWGIPAWKEHIRSWEGNWDVLVQFEDLKDDPATELRRMVTLFDREFPDAAIEQAVQRSSFENMRQMETKYGHKSRHGANPDYQFMRKGTSDQGEEYFDEDDYRYLQRTAGDIMEEYGYDVAL
jgi:hypothetical protein